VRIFKMKAFARFQRRERIADASLVAALRSAARGLVDADLGGGLIKLRVARPGAGKSGGYRTIVAYQRGVRAVFLYGFAKSEQANIAQDELAALRRRGARLLNAPDDALETMLVEDELTELEHGNED
jgi:hypothetical protein